MDILDNIKHIEKSISDIKASIDSIKADISHKEQELASLDISDLYTEQDFIDSCETEVTVLGETFNELELAKDITPITFRCAYNDWLDTMDIMDTAEAQELESEMEDLQEVLEDLEDQLEYLECELDDLND